jgi:glutamine synthetase
MDDDRAGSPCYKPAMAEKQMGGVLGSGELRDLVSRAEIDTVWAVTPDLCGRPIGKRFAAKFFIDEVLDRHTDLPAGLLFRDVAGTHVPPPSTTRVDSAAILTCRPDGATLRRAAWIERTAIVVCDLVDPVSGELHGFSPRSVLKRQLDRARSASVAARGACDLEFYLGVADGVMEPHRLATDHQAGDVDGRSDLVLRIQRALRASGVPVENAQPAAGPSQFQIAPQPGPLLEAADRAMITKWAVKEIARGAGCRATFMACPDDALPASAMEIHTGLVSADREAALFAGKEPGERGAELPVACRWWLGGLLRHARDATLLLAPTVNSYKRYRADHGGGSILGWARDRRTVGFCVGGDGNRRVVSCALAGADANPYLAGAAVLAAGLDGLANRIEPPAEVGRDTGGVRGLPRVPLGIVEAADLASRSTFLRQSIGEQYADYLAHCGRWEQARFEATVSSWETRRYWDAV